MKKFLLFLFFLLVIAGAGLYFGWAQAKVPPGSYGVLRSKTHGTAPEVIRDGSFRWIWYKLIPTNTETIIFTPGYKLRPLNFQGMLPSGRQYAFLAGIDSDFFWRITGEFSFSITPDELPSLTEKRNLTNQADFLVMEENLALSIENRIQQYLEKLSEDDIQMENLLVSRSAAPLINEIETAFPEIENFTCRFTTMNSPDFNVYRSVKALYQEYLNQFQLALSSNALLDAENRINQRLRFDELTQMGELLTQFPILLEYMALEKEINP